MLVISGEILYLATEVVPLDRLRQAELPSKADAPRSRRAAPDPSRINRNEGLVTTTIQPREPSPEGAGA